MEKKRFTVRQIPGLIIATIMGIPLIEGEENLIEENVEVTQTSRKGNGNGAIHDIAYTNTPNGKDARRRMKRTHPSGK